MVIVQKRLSAAGGVLIALVGLGGCSQRATAERRAFAPPFRADAASPNRLLVREDLLPKLKFEKVGTGDVAAKLVGYGRIGFAPDASYAVRVPYAGYVGRVLVEVDDVVKKGQPLVELRSSDVARLRAELANAEVELRAERNTLARLQRLVADGTATERELTASRAKIDVLEATVAGNRGSLAAGGIEAGRGERVFLRAPAPGRVLSRRVAVGERVSPDDPEPVLLIGDPRRLVVRASFPERDTMWLKEGAPCTVILSSSIGGNRFEGTLTRLVRAVDPKTRSTEAVCAPDLKDARVTAQMLARVEVTVTGGSRVMAPRSALLLRRDDYFVFVRVGNGALERRAVEPSLRIGDYVGIERGLQPGDEVITAGAVLLDGELDRVL